MGNARRGVGSGSRRDRGTPRHGFESISLEGVCRRPEGWWDAQPERVGWLLQPERVARRGRTRRSQSGTGEEGGMGGRYRSSSFNGLVRIRDGLVVPFRNGQTSRSPGNTTHTLVDRAGRQPRSRSRWRTKWRHGGVGSVCWTGLDHGPCTSDVLTRHPFIIYPSAETWKGTLVGKVKSLRQVPVNGGWGWGCV